jgi:hypothetical protein
LNGSRSVCLPECVGKSHDFKTYFHGKCIGGIVGRLSTGSSCVAREVRFGGTSALLRSCFGGLFSRSRGLDLDGTSSGWDSTVYLGCILIDQSSLSSIASLELIDIDHASTDPRLQLGLESSDGGSRFL